MCDLWWPSPPKSTASSLRTSKSTTFKRRIPGVSETLPPPSLTPGDAGALGFEPNTGSDRLIVPGSSYVQSPEPGEAPLPNVTENSHFHEPSEPNETEAERAQRVEDEEYERQRQRTILDAVMRPPEVTHVHASRLILSISLLAQVCIAHRFHLICGSSISKS